MLSQNKSEFSGFSLVELSLVLVIISVLIGMMMFTTQSRIDASAIYVTKERMQLIMDALDRYAEQYGHMPCPADFDIARTNEGYGESLSADSTNYCSTGTQQIYDYAGNADYVRGAIPFKNLGLDPSIGVDGWGMRFDYIVTERYTVTSDYTGSTPYGDSYLICNKTDQANCAAGTDIAANSGDDVAYILISHGANTYGGYSDKSGSRITASAGTGASDDEVENSDDDQYFVLVQPTTDFDDIIIFKQKWQMPTYVNTGF